MNSHIAKRIIYINEILFFFGWVIIFLLGADKPPPLGFLWIVLLVGILDICQYFYLKEFLPKLKQKSKGLFIKNLLYFLFAGLAVSLVTIITRLKLLLSMGLNNVLIWVAVIMVVGLLYGICFYIFNAILTKYVK